MPITDLTGTTWLINNYLGFGDGIFATTFNLTFTSNNKNYTQFYTNDEGTSESWIFEISYATSNNEWDNVYFYRVYDGEDYDTTQWIDQTYRTITITGGTDATNSNLIAWLQANATQQTAPTPTVQMTLGRTFIKKQIKSMVGVTGQFASVVDVYWEMGGTATFNITFTSNNQTFNQIKLEWISTGTVTIIRYDNIIVYDTIDYWDVNNTNYQTISITGGADATNSDMIDNVFDTYYFNVINGSINSVGLVPVSVMRKVAGSGGSNGTLQPLAIGYTSEWQPATYTITTNITNGTYSGDTTIQENGTATVTLSANSGYALPSTITVSGASYTYSSTTGVVTLSNFTGNITITAVCQVSNPNYLTFSSPSAFTLNVVDNAKYWDGTLYYSTDTTTWNEWSGTSAISSSSSGTTKYLYLRGSNNTYITGSSGSNTTAKWVLTGSNISCNGNIENLLDYQTVANGNHPTMASYCYASMFRSCTNLTIAPSLPATTLASYCYASMFRSCTNLTIAPSLPATTLADYCYSSMFYDCTNLTIAPSLPATTLADYCYTTMFQSCTNLTTPAIMAGGTTQATSGTYCCYRMYYGCTALNIYTSSSNHTAFYKSITFSTSSSATNYRSSYQMFSNCKINGTKSTTTYLTARTQYYY